MIYLHKLLPTFVLPIGVLLLLLTLAFTLRSRKIVGVTALLLYLLSMPLVSNGLMRLAEDFQSPRLISDMPAADTIVVLSGMLTHIKRPDGGLMTEWQDPDRFFAGVALWKAGKAPTLTFTAGIVRWKSLAPPEGEIFRDYAVQMGVPADRIVVTPPIETTEDEAREVSRLVQPGQQIILVTAASHMPRAKQLFTRAGVSVLPYPVDFRSGPLEEISVMDMIPSASSLYGTEIALRELMGRGFYALKGALSPAG